MQHKVNFFEQSTTLLNKGFSFKISCHTEVKEYSLPTILPIAGERWEKVHIFPKSNSTLWNAKQLVGAVEFTDCSSAEG